ncbi:MAG: cellulase family glycosylhydrolase [Lachnospiraceae bacterium]|nr:cellulase family glycosylhydrolase [Lachnospiraceae bacterium]
MKSVFCRIKAFCLIILSVLLVCSFSISAKAFEGTTNNAPDNAARPSSTGQLHLEGAQLVGENGQLAVLRGVSTHGLTYYPDYVNPDLFSHISKEWGANLVRLAMYSSDYCNGNQKTNMKLLKKGIQYAVEADMYVLVDWHILEHGNPNQDLSEAIAFFDTIAAEYANVPNVIFEICNEPNGDVTWADVRRYASCVIPVIKSYNENAVIIVGTPDFDKEISAPLKEPIEGWSNIMYTLHFYSATHGEELRNELENALNSGLPVFITECGFCEHTGDGDIDYEEAEKWMSLLKDRGLSYAVWSLSDKDEGSGMFQPGTSAKKALSDKNLSSYGVYVRDILRGVPMAEAKADSYTRAAATSTVLGAMKKQPFLEWLFIAAFSIAALLLSIGISHIARRIGKKKHFTYNDLLSRTSDEKNKYSKNSRKIKAGKVFLIISTFCSLTYLIWRIIATLPLIYGWVATALSILLLVVEIAGFAESLVHYSSMSRLRTYPLPEVEESQYPDVDVFIATYNESTELLRKTLVGCLRMKYPDKSKVHIYLCDDNRRSEMRALAQELGINYLDRPDNKGAKAGNLNHALSLSTSPYVVTFDADMIPREEFLLKTIPYFIDAEERNSRLPEGSRIPLGLIQTPQCFYNPDVFQHNLYCENRIPNEQDFFYRTVEAARTSENTVIYGGSNTILSRKALEAVGGFYTESITEDFATGLLIESSGFVSLGLPEPLASGLAPTSFAEHVKQRTRWGRGVIRTAKKLKIFARRGLSLRQKISYVSSVTYWFSPIRNLVYVISPLLFAVAGIPMFLCSFPELLLFWLPMFVAQYLCFRLISSNTLSTKWSGIQETSVMPFLLIPILQESFGISMSTFKVTNKQSGAVSKGRNLSYKIPFWILLACCIFGLIRVSILLFHTQAFGLLTVLYWLFRNVYFIIMSLCLVDGRDYDGENVTVKDAEMVTGEKNGKVYQGITTLLTEHSMNVFFDDPGVFRLGDPVKLELTVDETTLSLQGTVVGVKIRRNTSAPSVYTVEILDFGGRKDEYIYLLYNRVPTLPQSLDRDFGIVEVLFKNISERI